MEVPGSGPPPSEEASLGPESWRLIPHDAASATSAAQNAAKPSAFVRCIGAGARSIGSPARKRRHGSVAGRPRNASWPRSLRGSTGQSRNVCMVLLPGYECWDTSEPAPSGRLAIEQAGGSAPSMCPAAWASRYGPLAGSGGGGGGRRVMAAKRAWRIS